MIELLKKLKELKEKYKIPLVIDYRNSWLNSSESFYLSPYHRFRNRKLEQEVLRVADEVITEGAEAEGEGDTAGEARPKAQLRLRLKRPLLTH
jgi:hypothetical protein